MFDFYLRIKIPIIEFSTISWCAFDQCDNNQRVEISEFLEFYAAISQT